MVFKNFHLKISQGTISNTLKLSSKYLWIDLAKGGHAKRHKPSKISNMEKIVYEWFLEYQDCEYNRRTNLRKGKRDYENIKPYRDLRIQLFSGLAWEVKVRHGIKSFCRFGESVLVDTQDMENQLESIRGKIDQFAMKDVFKMDKTLLFHKLQADHSLATEERKTKKWLQ